MLIKHFKTIIPVAILIMILLLSYIFWQSSQESKQIQILPPKPPSQPSVAIDQGIETTFSQSEYSNDGATSETVKLTIRNTTEETYYLYTPACAAGWPQVQYFFESDKGEPEPQFVKQTIAISPPCNMVPYLDEFKSGAIHTFEWDQVNYSESEDDHDDWRPKFVPAGDYRMIISLFKNKEGDDRYAQGVESFVVFTQPFKIKYNKPSERISIISPDKGDFLKSGETYTIQWQGAKSDKVNLYYGVDWRMDLNPQQKQELVLNVANTGSYDWQVPNLFDTYSYGNDYVIKIEEVGGDGIGYSEVFKFRAVAKPAIIDYRGPREDRHNFSPAETGCNELMAKYTSSQAFSNNGFSSCELIEFSIGTTLKECDAFNTPLGCNICKFDCK